MLGLDQQVARDQFWIGAFIGQQNRLAWSGRQAHINGPIEQTLRRRDIRIARSRDLAHGRDMLGPICQSRDRLSAS